MTVEKIFAGIIEDTDPDEGRIQVRGGDFQRKLQLAAKTVEYDEEPIEDAAADMVSGLSEVTTGRVEAPAGSIEVTKKYQDVSLSDGLDELIQIAPLDDDKVWRWGLGMGQDLSFRPYDHTNVRTCTTSIVAGTNVLYGLQRGEDLYNLANKVIAISGLIKHPEDDNWCEDITDWSLSNILSFTAQTNEVTTGVNGMRIYADNKVSHYCSRAIPEFDASEYDRVVLDIMLDRQMEFAAMTLDIQFHSAFGGYFHFRLVKSGQEGISPDEWKRITIPLDHPMLKTSGSPSWTDIDEIRIFCINGTLIRFTYYVDNIHFEVDNKKATATAGSSDSYEDRTVVYHDPQIQRIGKIQDMADGLQAALQEAANRILVPVLGEPDLQRGRKVTVDIKDWDLDADYYIAEAEHIFGVGVGYTINVLLTDGRINLTTRMARTLQQDLRRQTKGATNLTI